MEFRFIAVDPSSLDFVDAGSYSDGPEILDAEDQRAYLHDAWTIGGPLDRNKLSLQLLPVYTWAKEGVERNQGLKDVQIIEINISEKSEHGGRK